MEWLTRRLGDWGGSEVANKEAGLARRLGDGGGSEVANKEAGWCRWW